MLGIEIMLEKLLGAAFKRVIQPLANGLNRAGLSANFLTVLGFLVTIVSAVVIGVGPHVIAGLVLLGGALFDTLDGAVARVSGTTSKKGAFLDSTLDRLSDAAMFIGIMCRFTYGPDAAHRGTLGATEWEASVSTFVDDRSLLGAGLALTALVLSLMVSYVRARAEGLGFNCKVGIAERPERILIVAAGLLIDQLVLALALLAIISAITLAQRFVHVWRQASSA